MKSCLICDDHPLVAQALAMTVAVRWPGATITLAADFPRSWAAAAARPELCLADLEMPGAPPRSGVAGIMAAAPTTRLIIVTGVRDDALLADLLALGIAGFLPKTSDPDAICAAIDLVLAGGRHLPPLPSEIDCAQARPQALLSSRQIEVAALLAKGYSNKEIARRIGVTPATVKTHVEQVLAALGATNRTEAAFKARQLGII